MLGEALAIGSVGIPVTQVLTGVLVGYILILAGIYAQNRLSPLVSWTVPFDGSVNLRAPGMWEIAWNGDPVENASLVILEIGGSGSDITDPGSWVLPLSFSFGGRKVVHFKVRDSQDFHELIQTPPFDSNTPLDPSPDRRAKILDEKIVLPSVPLKRKERFKLLVLLRGPGDGVTAGGRLKSGAIKKHGGHRRRYQIIAIGASTALALGLIFWAVAGSGNGEKVVAGGGNGENPKCAGGFLTLEGSTAFAPIAANVAHEYQNHCLGASSIVSAIGSGEGVAALKLNPDAYAIAMSDGPYRGGTSGLTPHPVGMVFFAVVANSHTTLSSLTVSELRGIFSGHPPGNYVAVGRISGSGTRNAFETKVLGPQRNDFPAKSPCPPPSLVAALSPTACTMDTTMDLLTYVNLVPNSIGYAEVDALPFFPNVKVVAIDLGSGAVLPTRDAVTNGLYPFVTTEYLYTVENPSDLTRNYIDFLTSHAITVQLRDLDFIACSDLPDGKCPPQ